LGAKLQLNFGICKYYVKKIIFYADFCSVNQINRVSTLRQRPIYTTKKQVRIYRPASLGPGIAL